MPGPYYNLAGMLDANSLWSSLTCLFWTLLKPMTKMAVMFLSWLNWGGGYVEVTDLVPKKFLKQMTTYTRNEQVRKKGGPGCLALLGRFLLPSWGWLWPNHGTHLTNQPDWFLMGMGFKCTRALNQIRKPRSGDPTFCLCSCRVVVCLFRLNCKSNVVLSGQVKQYFACESQHQQGTFDMTNGIQVFLLLFRGSLRSFGGHPVCRTHPFSSSWMFCVTHFISSKFW